MHSITLIGPKGEEYNYSFAADWNELDALQAGEVAAHLLAGLPDPVLRFELLRLLAGIPKDIFRRSFHEDMVTIDQKDQAVLLPQLDWLFTDPVLDVSLLPEVVVGKQRYTGPSSALGNFTVLQLSFADICFSAVGAQDSPEAIDNLMGALYYPDGTAWNNEHIEERGKQLAELPAKTKLTAWLNYRGLRNTLPLRYPRTFSGKEGSDDFGIDGLLEGLAGAKFGRADQVGGQPLHPVLVSCERTLIREAELKAQANQRA